MSNTSDVDEFRDEHESDEHWALRRAFILRWRDKYPVARLLCLARVFTNIEFMGCRYPQETMQEIASMSQDVANDYRSSKKTKLQRTFVSASDAAEDRAKGVKRKAGVVENTNPKRINFVSEGHPQETIDLTEPANHTEPTNHKVDKDDDVIIIDDPVEETKTVIELERESYDYLTEFNALPCLQLRLFREDMFHTSFGRMVLMVRNWMSRFNNVHSSCLACGMTVANPYQNGCMSLTINGKAVASATGGTKAEAKSNIETMIWNRMRLECVILVVKEQYIARDSERISNNMNGAPALANTAETGLATPVDSSVAAKMMKLMGWTGGGLGANEEGIEEPIKPHLQQVHRAGLGSSSELASVQQLKRKAMELMRKYRADDLLDYDLVFSADFSKEERSELHQVARRCGLNSRSYGAGNDRFLVVRKKIDPFSIARAVVQNGGATAKYQVYLPRGLGSQ